METFKLPTGNFTNSYQLSSQILNLSYGNFQTPSGEHSDSGSILWKHWRNHWVTLPFRNLSYGNSQTFEWKLHKLYQLSIHILDLIQTFDWELRRNHQVTHPIRNVSYRNFQTFEWKLHKLYQLSIQFLNLSYGNFGEFIG